MLMRRRGVSEFFLLFKYCLNLSSSVYEDLCLFRNICIHIRPTAKVVSWNKYPCGDADLESIILVLF